MSHFSHHIVPILLLAINLFTFVVYGIDKWKARHGRWRIPEATLLLLAAVGGSIGAWAGMRVWHHKTLHRKFRLGVPLIIIAQVALLVLTSCGSGQAVAAAQKAGVEAGGGTQGHSPSCKVVGNHSSSCKPIEKIREHSPSIKTEDGVEEHSPSVLIVMYDNGVGKAPLLKAVSDFGAEVVYDYSILSGMAIKKPEGKTLEETMAYFRKVEGVLTVDYDRIVRLDSPVSPSAESW